jgi:hypothetical protein
MTGVHFIDRKPRSEPCARCGQLQLLFIDEGIPGRCAPMPLNIHGELAARMAGRRTYGVHGDYLTHRDAFRMRGDATRGRPTVIATHACFEAVRPDWFDTRDSAVREIRRILAMAEKSDRVETAEESNAMLAIAETLGGLVISQEPAPF